MTPEEMACWIADSPPRGLLCGSRKWQALHDRALEVIQMTRNDALERAAKVAAKWSQTKPISGQDAKIIAAAMSSAGAAITVAIRELKEKS